MSLKQIIGTIVGFIGLNAFFSTFFVIDFIGEHPNLWQDFVVLNLMLGGCGLIALGFWLAVND